MSQYPGENPSNTSDDGTEQTAPITPAATPDPAPGPPPPSGPVFNPTSAEPSTSWTQPGGQPYGQPTHEQPTYQQPAYGQPAYGQQPAALPYQQFTPPPPYAGGPHLGFTPPLPNHPQATTAMVLGLVGLIGSLFTCGLTLFLCPFAWALGRNALKETEASHGRLGGESQARAGKVTGIIGTVLLVLAIAALILLVVGLAVGGGSSSFSTST